MKLKIILLFITSSFLIACSESEMEQNTVVQVEKVDPVEERMLVLQEKVNDGIISIAEQTELDSLEIEKYKKELEQSVLQMVEDNN